ncbi:MAG: hypothetical protein ACKO2K_15475 [Alphaproteobacteria bacterium]
MTGSRRRGDGRGLASRLVVVLALAIGILQVPQVTAPSGISWLSTTRHDADGTRSGQLARAGVVVDDDEECAGHAGLVVLPDLPAWRPVEASRERLVERDPTSPGLRLRAPAPGRAPPAVSLS